MATLWSGRSSVEELSEEMESHILEKADALEASGLSPDEALRTARRSFGNQALLQDRSEDVWSDTLRHRALTCLRFASVQLRREPLFVGVCILILGLGIGANTAIFTGLYHSAFRKLPVSDPDRLVFATIASPAVPGIPLQLSMPLLSGLEAQHTDLESLSGWMHDRVMTPDANGEQRSLSAMLLTVNAFDVLGVRPAAGRLLLPEDALHNSAKPWPVVLSDSYWSSRYHRSPAAIGEHVMLSGHEAEIVGVVPYGFDGITPNVPVEMYLPMAFYDLQRPAGRRDPLREPGYLTVTAVGRLREGVTIHDADLRLDQATRTWLQQQMASLVAGNSAYRGMTMHLSSASRGQQALNEYRPTLTLLQLLMAGVLVFCCISVAGLQLARGLERTHEFAVRVALGANQGHLIQQCMLEAMLLAAGGALLAVPVALVGTQWLSDFLTKPGAGEMTVVHPNWLVLASAVAVAMVCTVLVGIVPATFASQASPAAVLHSKSTLRRPPSFASRVLLITQLAVTFLLIATASYSWRTLRHLSGQELGYNPRHVTEVSAQFQELDQSPQGIMDLYRALLHALNQRSGIESATDAWITQLTTFDPQINVAVPGDERVMQISFNQIGPLYFRTLETKLLAGREFGESDTDDGHCIVNELAARQLLHVNPAQALGRKIRVSFYNELNGICEVVGVAANAKFANIHATPPPMLFLPITAYSVHLGGYNANMVFLLRGSDEQTLERAYVEVLAKLAPSIGHQRFLPMERQRNDALGRERLLAYTMSFFGGLAFLICLAATLSLLLMRVRQSIPEIAIRVALGASPRQAAGIVMCEMAVLLALGIVFGLALLGGTVLLSTHALHVPRPAELIDVCGAVILLLIVTCVAGGVPAWYAANLQPMKVLCRDA